MLRKLFGNLKIVFPVLFLSLFIFSGCDTIIFGGDLRVKLEEDIGVDFYFYEYPDTNSQCINKRLILGKNVSPSVFPTYEHETEFLVGWRYLENPENGSTTTPDNYSFNYKNYIDNVYVTDEPAALYAVWKKKCTITFVTNNSNVHLDPVVIPEGDCVQWPNVEKQGNYRLWNWYTEPDLSESSWYDFSQPVSGDFTLYGKWVEVRTIRYHKNDGSDYISEQDYQISEPNPYISEPWWEDRDGYGFIGWSYSPSGGVNLYPGNTLGHALTSDLDLYAVWTTDFVTITYIDMSGTYSSRSAKYGRGAHIPQLGQVRRENNDGFDYIFNIWSVPGKVIRGYSASSTKSNNEMLEYNDWGWRNSGSDDYIVVNSNMTFYVYWRDDVPYGYIHGDVTFVENPDNDIDVSVSQNGNIITFTVTGTTIYNSYKWKLNGEVQTGLTGKIAEFNTSTLPTGNHEIVLEAVKDSIPYSWSGQIKKN